LESTLVAARGDRDHALRRIEKLEANFDRLKSWAGMLFDMREYHKEFPAMSQGLGRILSEFDKQNACAVLDGKGE